tara:strand:- start:2757 stop:3011 length:255 start_codon:yes stop_codon:yes gene_type:complete
MWIRLIPEMVQRSRRDELHLLHQAHPTLLSITAAIGTSFITINMLKLFTTTDLMVLVGSVVAEQSTDRASRAVHAVMDSEVHTT